ncbi:MAG TPA: hypothetical protein VMF89_06535 [Polyangiales bacterium]|nr:hypothetical protein [Polyangiales bacterium]
MRLCAPVFIAFVPGTISLAAQLTAARKPAARSALLLFGLAVCLPFARGVAVADIEAAGLATPWASIPHAKYILWELSGFATIQLRGYERERDRAGLLQARIGDAGIRLTHVSIEQARSQTVLYNDGNTMVLELPTATTLSEAYRTTRLTRQ